MVCFKARGNAQGSLTVITPICCSFARESFSRIPQFDELCTCEIAGFAHNTLNFPIMNGYFFGKMSISQPSISWWIESTFWDAGGPFNTFIYQMIHYVFYVILCRLAAQEMIKQERTSSRQMDKVIGTVTVKREFVQSTRASRIQNKLIKEEPNIRLVHRKEKTPENVRIVVTHPSGRLCRHPDKGTLGIDELPDLPGNLSTSRIELLIRSPPRVTRTPRRPSQATAIADSSNTEENASALKELLDVQETVSEVTSWTNTANKPDIKRFVWLLTIQSTTISPWFHRNG